MKPPFQGANDTRGQALVKYVIIVAVVAIFLVAVLILLGKHHEVAASAAPAPATPATPAPAIPNSPETNAPATIPVVASAPQVTAPPANGAPDADPDVANLPPLLQAILFFKKNQLDAALAKVNAIIKAEPKNANAYGLRAAIDVKKMLYPQAESDFQTEFQLDTTDKRVELNLAEILFKEKKYDAARVYFAALDRDIYVGDFSAYKVFLCDLFAGHEDQAAKELDVFNQAGRNASYDFANAAWSLYHKKPEDARSWLESASDVYEPQKIALYASSLIELGYLPLPPPPAAPQP